MGEQGKPTFTLMSQPFTEEKLIALFKKLTGRDATPAEIEELHQEMARGKTDA
jgi:hypothetical protein